MVKQEALSALLTLGYSRPVAEKAVRRAVEELAGDSSNAEKLIKLSLKFAIM
jgi:Holliday junction resolvasome RuvABC DNA-binding subunit